MINMIGDRNIDNKGKNNVAYLLTYLDILDDAIVGLTTDFRISFWSKGAERELGYSSDEIINKSLKVIIPEDQLDEYENKISEVKSGHTVHNLETTRIHKNGCIVDVSVSISPILDNDGKYIGALAIYKDISEKIELSKKLQEYERKSRLALEGGQFGIWDYDLKENILLHYNNLKGFIGFNEAELMFTSESILNLIHPDDQSIVISTLNDFDVNKEYIVEFRIKYNDDKYKWIRTKGKAIHWSDDGKPLRMVGTIEDITDRKVIEQELKEKIQELRQLKQLAEAANKAKSQFLADITHGIRTPLNSIHGLVQLIELSYDKVEQKKYVEMLKESTLTLESIINDILDLEKIESGTLELKYEPFDLRKTIDNLYNYLLIMGNSKGLEISFYLDPSITSKVIGDELKLKQTLANLIHNAIKFTDDGFISFRVNLLSSEEDYNEIEFIIKDTGIGIHEDVKNNIFERFIQGNIQTKKKYAGSGLGLAISKKLSDLMNADLWFESTFGKGSIFYFRCKFKKIVSITNAEGQGNIEENHREKIDSNKKTILCAEDNIINQEVLRGIIKRKGYRYIEAYNGKEVLDILKENKVDLIIMDIQMPELNGFETTKIIRSDSEYINIPIIAITAYALNEDREKCIQAGMNDYLSKPIDIEKLYKLLEYYLGT